MLHKIRAVKRNRPVLLARYNRNAAVQPLKAARVLCRAPSLAPNRLRLIVSQFERRRIRRHPFKHIPCISRRPPKLLAIIQVEAYGHSLGGGAFQRGESGIAAHGAQRGRNAGHMQRVRAAQMWLHLGECKTACGAALAKVGLDMAAVGVVVQIRYARLFARNRRRRHTNPPLQLRQREPAGVIVPHPAHPHNIDARNAQPHKVHRHIGFGARAVRHILPARVIFPRKAGVVLHHRLPECNDLCHSSAPNRLVKIRPPLHHTNGYL